MSSLTRTRQGKFTLDSSYSLQDIEKNNYKLLTVEDIFDYFTYELTEKEYFSVRNGGIMKIDSKDDYIMMKYQNDIIAIYQKHDKVYKPYFML